MHCDVCACACYKYASEQIISAVAVRFGCSTSDSWATFAVVLIMLHIAHPHAIRAGPRTTAALVQCIMKHAIHISSLVLCVCVCALRATDQSITVGASNCNKLREPRWRLLSL